MKLILLLQTKAKSAQGEECFNLRNWQVTEITAEVQLLPGSAHRLSVEGLFAPPSDDRQRHAFDRLASRARRDFALKTRALGQDTASLQRFIRCKCPDATLRPSCGTPRSNSAHRLCAISASHHGTTGTANRFEPRGAIWRLRGLFGFRCSQSRDKNYTTRRAQRRRLGGSASFWHLSVRMAARRVRSSSALVIYLCGLKSQVTLKSRSYPCVKMFLKVYIRPQNSLNTTQGPRSVGKCTILQ